MVSTRAHAQPPCGVVVIREGVVVVPDRRVVVRGIVVVGCVVVVIPGAGTISSPAAHSTPSHMFSRALVVGFGRFVADVKPGVFEPETHASYETAHVQIPEHASLEKERSHELCGLNRASCEPFRFDLELRLWLDGPQQPRPAP